MKNKKLIVMVTVFLLFALFITGCAPDGGDTDVSTDDATASDITDESIENATSGVSDETTGGGTISNAPPKSLKILAIGNSFSTDSMEYLYQIAKDGGVETVVLGNLYYGGCSLSQHLGYGKTDSASYTYYKNTSGKWTSISNCKMSTAIADEEWDYISLQQASPTSGVSSSYGSYLTALVELVRKQNSSAKLIWNATWAYQQDSTHSGFATYNKSQQKMYDAIIKCVQEEVVSEGCFDIIIPCTTSIQNARTSFIGDKLTRDGYHLDYSIGRYIAGLTWFAAITGLPVDSITYNPSTQNITDDMMAVAKEAVTNAVKTPYAVTESVIKTGKLPGSGEAITPSISLDPKDHYAADSALAAINNIDLSKYTYLSWTPINNKYWNSTSKATISNSSAANDKQFICCDKKFSLAELPVGTVFITDDGWQYRLEKFVDASSAYIGTRPGMITSRFYVLDEAFVGNCSYFVWNICKNPKSDISSIYDEAALRLRVYIPNDAALPGSGGSNEGTTAPTHDVITPEGFMDADATLASSKGVDLTKYTLLEWEYVENRHWNSTSNIENQNVSSTDKQFICSAKKHTLSELPVGTVFIIDSGWQIRLEKFVDENTRYSGTRPGMITANYYVVEADFVKDANYFVWNVSANPRSDISAIYAEAAGHVRIYIPNITP